jgi:hypothetical protein
VRVNAHPTNRADYAKQAAEAEECGINRGSTQFDDTKSQERDPGESRHASPRRGLGNH